MQNKFTPQVVKSFEKSKNWAMISIGQHHTIAIDANGLWTSFLPRNFWISEIRIIFTTCYIYNSSYEYLKSVIC